LTDASLTGSTDRIVRHRLADRIFHWLNASVVVVLLGTSFLPIVGVKFAWVTIHWVAGVLLALLIIYHIVRALIWQDRRSMGLEKGELARAGQSVAHVMRRRNTPPDRPGKYPSLQKLFHHLMVLAILGVIVSGCFMLAKIDTPFWGRNPYFLSSYVWGIVYVIHGLTAMIVLAMVIVHIYFALRPEKLWITRSMILGWITREEYEDHHNPELWSENQTSQEPRQ